MKLEEYKELIRLDESYHPHKGDARLDELLELLTQDFSEKGKRDIEVARMRGESLRNIIKAIITVRPSGNVSNDLIDLVDDMLQNELLEKEISDASRFKRLAEDGSSFSKMSIWNGDITTLKVDAIVNAANSQLEGCFIPFHNCIDNAIHNAAGIQLREDCATIIDRQGHLEQTGQAKITRAYNLPSDYVIHTVGPIVERRNVSQQDKEDLRHAYLACLEAASETDGVRSIAFCSISTGIFGYPLEDATRLAITTVKGWLDENGSKLDHVIFNTYGDQATGVYQTIMKEVMQDEQ